MRIPDPIYEAIFYPELRIFERGYNAFMDELEDFTNLEYGTRLRRRYLNPGAFYLHLLHNPTIGEHRNEIFEAYNLARGVAAAPPPSAPPQPSPVTINVIGGQVGVTGGERPRERSLARRFGSYMVFNFPRDLGRALFGPFD